MAIEALFPLDLLMDACILAAVQLALDRLCPRRLMRSMLALSCMTVLCMLFPCGGILRFAAFPVTAVFLLGKRSLRTYVEASLALFCAYAAGAGFMLLTGSRVHAVFICFAAFCALLFRRRHVRSQWNIEILLEQDGHACSFTALIDTGNRLRERLNGLPVLIAEERILGGAIAGLNPDDCIPIPYGVLGSSGEILCFRPDRLMIRTDRGKLITAPECLIGVFPSRIPGSTRALAPPEFAQYPVPPSFPNIPFIKSCRRYSHVVFKHKAIHLWPGGSDPQGIGLLHRRQ